MHTIYMNELLFFSPRISKACPRFVRGFHVLNYHCREHVNRITCYQVSREEASINLNILVKRSVPVICQCIFITIQPFAEVYKRGRHVYNLHE